MSLVAKIIVVMPAFNAAQTLASTFDRIPLGSVDEVILVDDASRDATVEVAARLPIHTVVHPHNVGYGGNQKTCYMEALRRGAAVVVMVHPDGQYDPRFLPEIAKPILEDRADVVLGSRMLSWKGALRGGMPPWKFVSNIALTWVENLAFGLRLSEYHTGYRAFSRRFLEHVPFLRNSNDFVFDTEILGQAVAFDFRIAEIPVTTRYMPEASSVNFWVSVVYGTKTLWTVLKYLLDRIGLVRSRLFRR
jgi:glycosyltransferase involved in cell wall biosynthesis